MSRIKQAATATVICATVAALVGIATGAAAPSNKNGSSAKKGEPFETPFPGPPPGARAGGIAILGGPPVHSEMVVPYKAGDDFITVTQDSGKVKSVSGDQLTITEGTEEATYKTVTLDISSDATVLRNGKEVELGDLQDGDNVHVSQSPQDSFVFASDRDFFEHVLRKRGETLRHHRGMPLPSAVAGGLPPGLPPPPSLRREED